MNEHLFFYIGLALLLVHEMDAVRLKEWRLFVFLSSMPEERAYRVFTALHVPLYLLLFVGLWGAAGSGITQTLVLGLNLFFLVHVLLHVLSRRHPHYQFHSVFSWALILGCGICGVIDLLRFIARVL